MLESFPVAIAMSTLLGTLAALGVGGGSLLMLWLTLALSIPYSQARLINLMFFLPCALISSVFRRKQGALDLKKLVPAIITGCAAAILFSWLGETIEIKLIKKAFGILLLFTGLRELLYKPKN